ncbi:MAG TPA: pyridoxal-dependent decarboxylase [Methylomirabilota bacterium]|nr:pyridoxal-dependent decarboxylase [Methylomirabilota bacterium]
MPSRQTPMHAAQLEPTPAELRRWGEAVLDLMSRYHEGLRDRRVAPNTTSREIRAAFDRTMPEEGAGFAATLQEFEEDLLPLVRHNGHPRMFGYVQSPGVPVASLADLLASMLNANLTVWRSAPGPVEIERLAVEWVRQMVGAHPAGDGIFVSGGSMANFSALAAARRTKAPIDIAREGAHALPRAMRLYVSPETHHSVAKAATLLGIGSDHVREVPVDDGSRMRVDSLETMIEEDRRSGYHPFCIAGTAGTVGTGAIDPLDALADVAERHGLWFHIDASYGGFAALAPAARAKLGAFARADSIALDPHKWMYLPVDCGCVLYRDPAAAYATFAHDAEYMRVMDSAPAESFAYWNYGPELSRRFRALKVWMMLRAVGIAPLRAAVEKDLACAALLAEKVEASRDFERLAPVELSIVCFRHVPARGRRLLDTASGADREAVERALDAWNERLLVALQRDGSSYMSNASVGGRFALRACIMNHRTTLADMDVLLADLRRIAGTLGEF